MMGTRWEQAVAAAATWSLRERVLVLGAVLAALGGLTYLLAVEPFQQTRARQAAEAATWQTELATLRAQLEAAAPSRQTPQVQAQARRVTELNAQLAALAREIEAAGADASQVGQLRPAVYRLLSRHERVQLVALEAAGASRPEQASALTAVAPAVLAAASDAAAATAPVPVSAPGLQRYTVQVTLEGAYLDLLAYLESLERELPQVRWADMKLSAVESGGVRLNLNLYMWWRPA